MADTRETIQARMLQNINDSFDRSTGSFFFDATKPVAIELEGMGADIDGILDKGFATTATGEYLDRKVAEQGLNPPRKPATKATGTVQITGQQGATIAKGIKVASDTVTYTVTSETTVIGATNIEIVSVECDQAGSIGDAPVGAIKSFPVTIAGLSAVTNPAAFTDGYDGESDTELRQRYFEKVRTPPTSGNVYHYRSWAKEVTGVGDARIFPLWNGNGTVKVVIIDSNKQPADAELISDVTTHIEDVRPIGATVTVVSAAGLSINIVATLTLATGYTLNQVKGYIETNITNYLKSIAFIESAVSYARIGSTILSTEGVLDYTGLTVNGGTSNIAVSDLQVAILGTVTVS
ncbi:MAG: Baseplate J-like protein [Pelotomaculum sp. PtaB.Bin104]|nr:MAG: Baseplate J-like protein [Pelotomaculum sp. PtaB.Bin104]